MLLALRSYTTQHRCPCRVVGNAESNHSYYLFRSSSTVELSCPYTSAFHNGEVVLIRFMLDKQAWATSLLVARVPLRITAKRLSNRIYNQTKFLFNLAI